MHESDRRIPGLLSPKAFARRKHVPQAKPAASEPPTTQRTGPLMDDTTFKFFNDLGKELGCSIWWVA